MKENFCYIHIPFCTSKCKYCRFASYGILNSLKINLYVKNLLKEIKNNNTGFNNLKSVYFGGGTPSILTINQIELIINTLKNKFIFNENIEITLEVTPVTITKQNLIGWKKIGINRVSIGVQTLNNKTLIEIGRGEKGDVINALNNIKEVGFNNISVDFIIGLPFVKKGEIKKDIEFLLKNYDFIKHISIYMLEEYYNIPEEIDSKFEKITYPNNWNKLGIKEKDYLGEYIEISNFLKEKGFNKYEISNFAKIGYECIHNKAYWNHSNILAFGLGAHGYINNVRYSNSEDFLEYYSGKNIVFEKLTKEDIFLEKLMFGLRTSGINKEIYKKLDNQRLNYFLENNYLKKLEDKIILSSRGVLILDYILREVV